MNMTATPVPAPLAGFLHVVFHGAFCFFDNGDDNIYVRVPLVTNQMYMGAGGGMAMPAPIVIEHAYIAGNWLNERTYMSGQFQLQGVETGAAELDPAKNLNLTGAKFADNVDDKIYAEMTFPRPDRIDSLQCGTMDPQNDFAGGDLDMVQNVVEVSTVQVFTYRFLDHTKLALPPHPPSAFQGEDHLTGGFCSLHLFAEPDNHPPDNQHSHHAFQAGLAMYCKEDGSPIDLDIVNPPKIRPVDQKDVPYGTILAELEDLPARLARLSALGVRRLENDDLNGIFDPDAAADASDPVNCMSMAG
jgi:hypothetical protein